MQPTVSACLTDTLYKSRSHPSEREPTTNRAKPDSPKILFSGPIQIYQHGFELSIHLKAVDGSSRQRTACQSFSTWQAGHTRKSMQIFSWNRSRIGNWQAVSRWTVPELGEQCSDPDRNHFRQIWLVGIIPNPYDRTSASCAFFQNAFIITGHYRKNN